MSNLVQMTWAFNLKIRVITGFLITNLIKPFVSEL